MRVESPTTIPCAFCDTEVPPTSDLRGWVLVEGFRYACPKCVREKRHLPPKRDLAQ